MKNISLDMRNSELFMRNEFSGHNRLGIPYFSVYADMDPWRQIESVAKNRWCGAYWQSKGLLVVPTIAWAKRSSYDYCFTGVEKNSYVAVGTVGCRKSEMLFMEGYKAMLQIIEPSKVICFGEPFDGMEGDIIYIDYRGSRKVVR